MRALVTDGKGGVVLRDVDEPTPGPDQAVVEVRAFSLNRGDVRAVAKVGEGRCLGSDAAGVVAVPAAAGTGPPEGTPVIAVVPAGGGWAERVSVPTELMAAVPDGLTLAAATTLPISGLTALRTLHVAGTLADRRVLVTGAAGGVGRFAVQLAAHDGADVTAVIGTLPRAADLERLGASRVELGMPEDDQFDVILESVGGTWLAAALRLVSPHGTIVCFGNSSGEVTTFDARTFYPRNGARLCAFELFAELDRLGTGAIDLAHLADLAAHGRLEASVVLELSWREAGKAMQALMDRQVQGKAVLTVD